MPKKRPLTLAVFVDQVFWFDGHSYSTNEAFTKFVLAFEPYFDKIVLYGRVAKERMVKEYKLDNEKITVHPLRWYDNVISLWARWPVVATRAARLFSRTHHEWDILWLCMPHPLGPLFARQCRSKGKPLFLMIRQNMVEQIRHRNRGLRKMLAMTAARVLERYSRSLAATHPTFTVGDEMYQVYKRPDYPVFPCAVSLITAEQIKTRKADERSMNGELRLLSVGRLDPEKGLSYLLKSLKRLITEKGIKAVLRIVGTGSEEQRLKDEVRDLGLEGHVEFLGYVAFGPELLRIYEESDMFLLPSLTGEGLPQVLLEAMACGVPIVATRVAGIPHLIGDGEQGLLIDPRNTDQLIDAICRLGSDTALRKKIRENGFKTVKEHTMEAEVEKIIAVLRDHFPALEM